MEPHQKLHHLFHNLLRKLFAIIGHDIFREGEFSPYMWTYVIWATFGTFGLGVYKTLLYYDMDQILNMLAFIGIALEVIDAKKSIFNFNHSCHFFYLSLISVFK